MNYQYCVTGGQIVGTGPKVTWNVTSVDPGPYDVTVQVRDKRGGVASKTTKLNIVALGQCPLACADVVVSCPGEAEENQSITFGASVRGGEPNVNPIYKWTISAGTIIRGQGTHRIEVDSTGLSGRPVTATLEVGGYPPECQSKASCRVQIRQKQ